jgi:flagellar biosynthesis protein FliP
MTNALDLNKIIDVNSPVLSIFILISLLSLLPAILVMLTSFTRIVVVLSLLKQGLGAQQIPPNPVIIGLSLFLTLFVMSPTINAINHDAVQPYTEKKINLTEAFNRAEPTIKKFMLKQTRQKDIALFVKLSKEAMPAQAGDIPLKILIPAFAISELKTAFEIGFLIFLPFLVIDMVVASILLSMGMMMLPPVMIALPFKLLLFVLVDGWNLIIGSVVRTFQ